MSTEPEITFEGGVPSDTEWTAASRASFLEAKDQLIQAITRHADYFSQAERTSSFVIATQLNEDLLNAAIAYAEAQTALSGSSLPFGDLQPWRIF
ncbi:hypothetical protein ACPEEZ_12920 [Frigoribacterium sp. 2-23]|uniref:hypothetical protein n=1 Tax=Frigoribacterium sp. 2-23 TaxID=3415006 RepID=UPI003C702EB0